MGDQSGDWPVAYPYRHYCPYCRAMLKVYVTDIEVEYEIPIIPPAGARDLGLKRIEQKTAGGAPYALCPKCNAQYYCQDFFTSPWLRSVEKIPDKDTLLNEFIKTNIPQSARIIRAQAKHYIADPNYRNPQPDDCFIATSVYGSPDALEVQILRRFKNNFLLRDCLGKSFISFYYYISPFLVRRFKNKKKIKLFIKRILLDPLVNLISVYEKGRF